MPRLRATNVPRTEEACKVLSKNCDGTALPCPIIGKIQESNSEMVVVVRVCSSPRDQKDLVLILLYKHFPGLKAQRLVPANREELGRLASSLVTFTDTALIGRTVIEVKPNPHRMFGATFTAKYVNFVLRHDKTTSL
jgi:hypothetical protein